MRIKFSFSRMYQMGPKSPSVNGSGKPQVVSDAQAREKLAVSFQKNPQKRYDNVCCRYTYMNI